MLIFFLIQVSATIAITYPSYFFFPSCVTGLYMNLSYVSIHFSYSKLMHPLPHTLFLMNSCIARYGWMTINYTLNKKETDACKTLSVGKLQEMLEEVCCQYL